MTTKKRRKKKTTQVEVTEVSKYQASLLGQFVMVKTSIEDNTYDTESGEERYGFVEFHTYQLVGVDNENIYLGLVENGTCLISIMLPKAHIMYMAVASEPKPSGGLN